MTCQCRPLRTATLALLAGLLAGLAAAPAAQAANARGYEPPIDPRDIANPAGVDPYAANPNIHNGRNYITETGRSTNPVGAGYYIDPTTGRPVPDPVYAGTVQPQQPPQPARPSAADVAAYSGAQYRNPGQTGAAAPAADNQRRAWYNPTGWFRGRRANPGYEEDPRPAVVPTIVDAPTPPGPVYHYPAGTTHPAPAAVSSPYANTYQGPPQGHVPQGYADPSRSELVVTGIPDGTPADVGISLPRDSGLQVTTRSAPSGTYGGVYSAPPVTPVYGPDGQPYGQYAPATGGPPPPGGAHPATATARPAPPAIGQTHSAEGRAAFENAKNLMRSERYDDALREIENALRLGYVTAEVYRWQGDGLYNLLRLEEAIRAYNTSRDLGDSYFARRGSGLAHLHRGHQIYGYQREAEAGRDTEAMVRFFMESFEQYKQALEILRKCNTERPEDIDAVYGLAMAAEGTSRLYYSQAISAMRKRNRQDMEKAVTACLETIKIGLDYAYMRYDRHGKANKESGPLALAGGLFLRRAKLYFQQGNTNMALNDVQMAMRAHRMILDEVDPNNADARASLRECEREYQSMSGANQ